MGTRVQTTRLPCNVEYPGLDQPAGEAWKGGEIPDDISLVPSFVNDVFI